jgi:taurine dioxygenase
MAAVLQDSFQVELFDAPLGAEILGLDLNRPLPQRDFQRIHKAHLDHHLLVFRDQRITPQQQVDFSRRFGPLQIHVLRNFQRFPSGSADHLQHHRERQAARPRRRRPFLAFRSVVQGKAQPRLDAARAGAAAEGGDTLFANMHLAYDTLPAALRHAVQGARAEHSYLAQYEELRRRSPWRPALTQAQIDEVKPVEHPVVRTHPETGRKALFVSEHFTTRIVGLPEDEPRAAGRVVRAQRQAGACVPPSLGAA